MYGFTGVVSAAARHRLPGRDKEIDGSDRQKAARWTDIECITLTTTDVASVIIYTFSSKS